MELIYGSFQVTRKVNRLYKPEVWMTKLTLISMEGNIEIQVKWWLSTGSPCDFRGFLLKEIVDNSMPKQSVLTVKGRNSSNKQHKWSSGGKDLYRQLRNVNACRYYLWGKIVWRILLVHSKSKNNWVNRVSSLDTITRSQERSEWQWRPQFFLGRVCEADCYLEWDKNFQVE